MYSMVQVCTCVYPEKDYKDKHQNSDFFPLFFSLLFKFSVMDVHTFYNKIYFLNNKVNTKTSKVQE